MERTYRDAMPLDRESERTRQAAQVDAEIAMGIVPLITLPSCGPLKASRRSPRLHLSYNEEN